MIFDDIKLHDVVLMEDHKNYGFGIVTAVRPDNSVLVHWPERYTDKAKPRELLSKNPCIYYNTEPLIHVYNHKS